MKLKPRYILLLIGPLLILNFQNCAKTTSDSAQTQQTATQAATYEYIETTILIPKCFNCHHGGLEFGGLNITTYDRVMEFVTPGDPDASPLYTRVFRTTTFTLTTEEKNAMKAWILNGAKNDF